MQTLLCLFLQKWDLGSSCPCKISLEIFCGAAFMQETFCAAHVCDMEERHYLLSSIVEVIENLPTNRSNQLGKPSSHIYHILYDRINVHANIISLHPWHHNLQWISLHSPGLAFYELNILERDQWMLKSIFASHCSSLWNGDYTVPLNCLEQTGLQYSLTGLHLKVFWHCHQYCILIPESLSTITISQLTWLWSLNVQKHHHFRWLYYLIAAVAVGAIFVVFVGMYMYQRLGGWALAHFLPPFNYTKTLGKHHHCHLLDACYTCPVRTFSGMSPRSLQSQCWNSVEALIFWKASCIAWLSSLGVALECTHKLNMIAWLWRVY